MSYVKQFNSLATKTKFEEQQNLQFGEQQFQYTMKYSSNKIVSSANNNCASYKDNNSPNNNVSEGNEDSNNNNDTNLLKTKNKANEISLASTVYDGRSSSFGSDKFKPKLFLEDNKLLDYICTCIYAHMTVATSLIILALIWLVFTKYYYVTIFYVCWMLFDRNTCNRGGRRWNQVYYSEFYKRMANYFPIKLRYSDKFQLDPNENYLLNYHPHGISAFGCVAAFGTDGLHFSERFPGMTSTFLVHETSFLMPIMREVFGSRGDCSVNSKSIDYLLSKSGKKGQLLALVVGGLAEMDLSDKENLKIVIAKRKGFIKKALQHGAHIIPCIGFGENSVFTLFDIKKNSLVDRFRSNFYRLFGFKHPFYYGKSIFTSKWRGIIPYQNPITVSIGDPIPVMKKECPTQEQIDSLHERYMEAVMSLYNSNSDLCHRFDRKIELV